MNLKKINFYIVNKKKLSLFYNDNNIKINFYIVYFFYFIIKYYI